MKRVSCFCFLAATSLAMGMSTAATAQEFVVPGAVVDADGDGFVDGSFGGNYVQRPPVVGAPGNRWNMFGAAENSDGMAVPHDFNELSVVVPPGGAVAQPQPFAGPPRAAAAPQPRNVVVRRGLLGRRRVVARAAGDPVPYQTPLPQSRIYGEGAVMAPNAYAPAYRGQTYGAGYGLGPYGTTYSYSQYYQGRPLYP